MSGRAIDLAIEQLAAEVDAFGQGTAVQPKPGTPAFFLLRAKSLGLSLLRDARVLELEGEEEFNTAYKIQLAETKQA